MPSPMQDAKYKVTTPFGVKGRMWSSGRHEGVDYAAPVGAVVVAPCAGKVVQVGQVWGAAFGRNSVLLRVEGGHLLFAHLSANSVKVGQTLAVGDVIGKVGAEGNVTGPHLHMELQAGPGWKRGGGLDPAKLIAGSGEASVKATPVKAPATKVVTASKVKFGATNQDIKIVQSALVKIVGASITVDGKYGETTKDAYKKWQEKLGFKGKDADGIPGIKSLTELGNKHGFKIK